MNFEWWKQAPGQVKFLMITLSSFVVSFAAVAAAWPSVEPFVYAHRGYVREYVQLETNKLTKTFEPHRLGLIDVQLSIARSRRAAINDRILTLEIEVTKSDSPEEVVKRRAQIERLREEREELDVDIKALVVRRDRD